ncbi:hypothetical protein HanIR_Chr07g0332131 [Helianthus annuus]|nr:hypothetical protein HanIR_Chr07g0332131 [Helianthus annuus]
MPIRVGGIVFGELCGEWESPIGDHTHLINLIGEWVRVYQNRCVITEVIERECFNFFDRCFLFLNLFLPLPIFYIKPIFSINLKHITLSKISLSTPTNTMDKQNKGEPKKKGSASRGSDSRKKVSQTRQGDFRGLSVSVQTSYGYSLTTQPQFFYPQTSQPTFF